MRFGPDPIPERPETDKTLLEPAERSRLLMSWYERMRRQKSPGYSLGSGGSYEKRFRKLARLLEENGIGPGEYLDFAFRLYSQPYINMICSPKTVAAFLKTYDRDEIKSSIDRQIAMLRRLIKQVGSIEMVIQRLSDQIPGVMWFFVLSEQGEDPDDFLSAARSEWLFAGEEIRRHYRKEFPSIDIKSLEQP